MRRVARVTPTSPIEPEHLFIPVRIASLHMSSRDHRQVLGEH
jgi:hypothetical protein